MNNRKLSLLCFLALPILLQAQNQTWHKRFRVNAYNASLCQLVPEGDQFLIRTNQHVIQMDPLGSVTGYLAIGANYPNWPSALKRYNPTTGHPYFIAIRRAFLGKDFTLAEYRPGAGFVNELNFTDSIGSSSTPRPHLVDLGGDSLLVFGRKNYWKVHYNPTGGFTVDWTRPLSLSPTSVLQHNNLFILTNESGWIEALDSNGDLAWIQYHSFSVRDIKAVSDGYIACGEVPGNIAAVMKLAFDGTEVWKKTYPDRVFHQIVQTSDGGYAVAGLSAGLTMVLHKLDASGGVSWSREYGETTASGGGSGILQLPDGGYLFLGRGKTALHCIRTDALGNAPESERAYINTRLLANTALESEFFPGSVQFFDGNESTFIAHEDSSAATLFALHPWLAGIDAAGDLHLAAGNYNISGWKDYRSGGVHTAARDFERVWAVDRSEIRSIRADKRLDNQLDEPIPFDLLTWPGKGNPHFRYNLDFTPVTTDPALFPAPFVDVNNDGIYNVFDGDYPRIKGEQMAWWLFSDDTIHSMTNGTPLEVDFQAEAYTYACVQSPLVEKSLFLDLTLINRSSNTYSGTYLGFFQDPDLGCFQDDNIGTLPQVNSWYVYNADALDENCYPGIQGFGPQIPVQSVSFLNHALSYATYHINPGVGSPPPGIIDPDLPIQFYRYLEGKWRDGTWLTVGGMGYNPGSLDITRHFFPDNPADVQGWSMCTENLSFLDRRVVTSHGPFVFAAADTFFMQLAFTRHSDIPHPCPDIFSLVVPPLEQLNQWHSDAALDLFAANLAPVYTLGPGQMLALDAAAPGASYAWSTGNTEPVQLVSMPGNYTVTITGATGCELVENVQVQIGTGAEELPAAPAWRLWPNPAHSQVFIDCQECDPGTLWALVYNAQGRLLRRASGTTVDVEGLPAGVYWLELRDARGWLGVKRVVVWQP